MYNTFLVNAVFHLPSIGFLKISADDQFTYEKPSW